MTIIYTNASFDMNRISVHITKLEMIIINIAFANKRKIRDGETERRCCELHVASRSPINFPFHLIMSFVTKMMIEMRNYTIRQLDGDVLWQSSVWPLDNNA